MLWSRIVSGYYPAGTLIGTESELAEKFGVSRITIRQALDILAGQRLVDRRRSQGTFVAQHIVPRGIEELNGFLDDIILQADSAGTIFAEKQRVKASPEVAQRLEVKAGSTVVRLRRLRANELGPKVWLVNYLPLEVGKRYSIEVFKRESLLRLLDGDARTHLADGVQTIGARNADREIAKRLGIDPGAPVLYVERVVYSEAGKPLEYVCLYYPADRFKFTVRLTRLER